MKNYTLRVTTEPIVDDNWDAHDSILDDVRGATLIENPNAPVLIFDVDADSWNKAQMFALGLADLVGFSIVNIERVGERPSLSKGDGRHIENDDFGDLDQWVESAPKHVTA